MVKDAAGPAILADEGKICDFATVRVAQLRTGPAQIMRRDVL
jgi:hypothetical protein